MDERSDVVVRTDARGAGAGSPRDRVLSTSTRRGRLTFAGGSEFQREVKRRVLQELERARASSRASPRMVAKTAVLLVWFSTSYALLVLAATSWWHGALLALSLALAMAGIGFGVQHDANHGAYSRGPAVNRIMGFTLDVLGGSSYVWRYKHNVAHHTYTNVTGADDDIDVGPLARLSPTQPRRRAHALQHFYMWALYGLLAVRWHLLQDFVTLARGRIGGTRVPRPRGWDLVELVSGKALFFSWVFVLPSLLHPVWVVLVFYTATSLVLGLVLSVVFQLAHCVEEANFPRPVFARDRLPDPWAVHQVQTTVDFAPRSRVLAWYLGGLNFQIEHHLFPRISHVHYPLIAGVVRDVCREFGVRYTVHESLLGAIASHWRWLRRMGRSAESMDIP